MLEMVVRFVAEVQRIARPYLAGEHRRQGSRDWWVVWLALHVLQVPLLLEAAMAARRNDQPLLDHRSWHRLADAGQRGKPTRGRSRHADQPPFQSRSGSGLRDSSRGPSLRQICEQAKGQGGYFLSRVR